jgi:fructokinase
MIYTNSVEVKPIAVWGEVLWDRFPDGDQLGGAPANVAWHLARRGGHPILITRVGDDADGRRAVEALARGGVDTGLVQVDPARATGEVTIALDARGEPRYTLVPERAWERIAMTPAVRAAAERAAAIVYGTLSQRAPEGLAAWRELVAATPPGCVKACDPNLRPTRVDVGALREALEAADVVKVNKREVELIRAHLGWPDPVATLRARCRVVAVTRGADGSTLYAGGDVIDIPGVAAAPGGDTVGCGDAYLAVLVQGIVDGGDLAAVGAEASAWAARVAGCRGATPAIRP